MMNFLRRWILHNFWLKILSLVLATGLWLAISPDQEPAEITLRVPIEFRHVPPQLEISSVNIPEAQVRVRGPEQMIRELRSTDIHADLELKDANPGERTFNLTAQQIHVQRDLTVVQVVPVRVTVTMEMSAPAASGH
ncbi:MAG TPA: CdaR family protein [Acidobacteriaceae bacterium]|jgi:YbbR domain-containing protein|nr:CdaR family protein [Acidobacteriaceae bacterium]